MQKEGESLFKDESVLDFDYLPLPDLMDGGAAKGGGKKGNGTGKKKAE